jgi:hypothetical protein
MPFNLNKSVELNFLKYNFSALLIKSLNSKFWKKFLDIPNIQLHLPFNRFACIEFQNINNHLLSLRVICSNQTKLISECSYLKFNKIFTMEVHILLLAIQSNHVHRIPEYWPSLLLTSCYFIKSSQSNTKIYLTFTKILPVEFHNLNIFSFSLMKSIEFKTFRILSYVFVFQ